MNIRVSHVCLFTTLCNYIPSTECVRPKESRLNSHIDPFCKEQFGTRSLLSPLLSKQPLEFDTILQIVGRKQIKAFVCVSTFVARSAPLRKGRKQIMGEERNLVTKKGLLKLNCFKACIIIIFFLYFDEEFTDS